MEVLILINLVGWGFVAIFIVLALVWRGWNLLFNYKETIKAIREDGFF